MNSITKVCIICPEHGEFWQLPYSHLSGRGCNICSKPVYDTNSFIKRAREIHGNKYDYSKVEYVNSITKVCIICPEHGEFWQTPNNHLGNKKCHLCSKINYCFILIIKSKIYRLKILFTLAFNGNIIIW